MTKYEHETYLEDQERKLAINMLLGRTCDNCDWLLDQRMKCQKRIRFAAYEYGELPEEKICIDWKEFGLETQCLR
jgi:hypothetical protein